ncbi:MAG: dTMP kinase [Lactobacillaceae bacterium]|jgi:dTMP kinase|nr:dTMP kinase [Lactobacillaceae bacterium]
MAGTFISFEGPDGAGKTSVLNAIIDKLTPLYGADLLLTREPGGTNNKIAETIRDLVLSPEYPEMDPRTEVLLFAASRRQHVVQTLQPAIAAGKLVITDRYVDSSIAYQGAGREIGVGAVTDVNAFAIEGFLPDLTIYLDVRPEVGLERINTTRTDEINRLDMDALSFHQRVSGEYHQLAKQNPERYMVINAEQPLDTVIADAWAALKVFLKITD